MRMRKREKTKWKGEAQSNKQQRKARVNERMKKGELEGRIKMFSELNRLM